MPLNVLRKRSGGVLKRPAAPVSGHSLTAKELQDQYGDLLQQTHFSECPSAYLLHSALSRRTPPIHVSMGAVKTWCQKYKHGNVQFSVSSCKELHEKYGDLVNVLAVNSPSAYLLVRALRDREPAVYISDEVAKQWLKKYFNLSNIDNAGHLESRYGELLREHMKQHILDATGVSRWLVGRDLGMMGA